METASVAKRAVRNFEKVVDLGFIIFLLSFIVYGTYAIWETNQMYHRASSSFYTAYRPTREETLGFEELQAINPNIFGWITVFGTTIDYPLLQADDNIRYVYTDARGRPSRAGAIFLDTRNDPLLTDFNNIIYGHDMTRDAMFGELARFQLTYFFESRQFGSIFNGEDHYGIEFFAFMEANAYDFEIYNPNMVDESLKEQLLARIEIEALQFRDIGVTAQDRLIVLSTCTPTFTDGRHLLIGRLMDDVPHDIFEGEVTPRGVDAIAEFGWFSVTIGIVFILLLTIAITRFFINLDKKKKIKAGLIPPVEVIQLKKKVTSLKDNLLFLAMKIMMIGGMVFVLFTYVFGMVQVTDLAMLPSMLEGDLVLFQRLGPEFIAQDVVVVEIDGALHVRRVVAIAGDVVDIHEENLFINERLQRELYVFDATETFPEGVVFPYTVPEGHVFVMGDSRGRSIDSRIYGGIPIREVRGLVVSILGGRGW